MLKNLPNTPLNKLIFRANTIKNAKRKGLFELCSIYNIKSGKCTEDCSFCAQSSRYKTDNPCYPIKSADEVCFAADKAKKAGAIRFSIVASGKGPTEQEIEIYAGIISKIRAEVDIKLCASLGIIEENALKILKQAGLTRYHHNIETSRRFYPEIVTTHPFEDRIKTITNAKKAGLEVCSGGIINLGENWDDRLSMIETLSGLDIDSIPLNILMPITGTPLEKAKPIPIKDIIRTIAMFRISFPEKLIIIAGGREACLGDFQSLAYWAGADGMMVGGYLTISGNEIARDRVFAEEFKGLY